MSLKTPVIAQLDSSPLLPPRPRISPETPASLLSRNVPSSDALPCTTNAGLGHDDTTRVDFHHSDDFHHGVDFEHGDGYDASSESASVTPQPPAGFNSPYGSQTSSPPEFIDQYDPKTGDFLSRYIEVVDAHMKAESPLQAVAVYTKQYKVFETAVLLEKGGRVYMRFDDFSKATDAVYLLSELNFQVEYITQEAYAQAKFQDPLSLNPYEGQLKITYESPFEDLVHHVGTLEESIREMCALFGTLRHASFIPSENDYNAHRVSFRVEFQSIDAATRACALVTATPINFVDSQETTIWYLVDVQGWAGPRTCRPTTTVPRDAHGRLIGFQHASNAAGTRRSYDFHNRVDVDRIAKGHDVRSTVMLRNIPNKLDWLGLKQLLDKFCFGTYDFVYLRIDFQTQANVGYAFINFADIQGLVAMIENVNGRPWAGFNSNKAAEISYATIQGKEALVTKFRNSSVMSETHNCRPRLFFTHGDATSLNALYIAGSEQEFPEPDNRAKLERSKASVHQVGLFPPRNVRNAMFNDRRTRCGTHDNGNPRESFGHHHDVYGNHGHHDMHPARFNVPDNVKKACEAMFSMPFHHLPEETVAHFVSFTEKFFNSSRSHQVGPIRRPY
ncbi:RNA recognition motif 2-domain-containing protein [Dendryphion nanum]|uniref:RNA recognition motif 2-domain-containing protein n=1 Tax=Dendryphion nanum TaxID=256645 RepID=A0A9P9DN44_9PLEO|nr:RNA recognition motif 2-domain-containing protein [Dendryphion nanum]